MSSGSRGIHHLLRGGGDIPKSRKEDEGREREKRGERNGLLVAVQDPGVGGLVLGSKSMLPRCAFWSRGASGFLTCKMGSTIFTISYTESA